MATSKEQMLPHQIRKAQLRTVVRGAYDIQKLRIQMGNRLAAQFRQKLGLKPSEKEAEDKEAKKMLDRLRASFKKITDGIKKELPTMKQFKGDELISSYTELVLLHQYLQLEKDEDAHFTQLGKILEEYPLYTEWLKPHVHGCGPAMSAVILSEIDIHTAKYVSSIWMYAGLDVAPDGQGRTRKEHHLVDREYLDKDEVLQTRKSITFNPFLKTKLTGVLGPSFLKAGGKYREVYDGYKTRLDNHPGWSDKSKLHKHNAALRYCVKMFIKDLYVVWRELEGLQVWPSYEEAKLGLRHGSN
jgi:hypothetical protein